MGLDWCVKEKVISGEEFRYEDLLSKREAANKRETRLFNRFLEEEGLEPPVVWPNEVSDRWSETTAGVRMSKEIEEIVGKISECVVSPMQTLEAPRVGIDEEATKHATDNFNENDCVRNGHDSLQSYLKHVHGQYVPDLAKKKDGLGSCTGIATGAESFRGKMLNYVGFLEGFPFNWYEDKTPDELVEMGEELELWESRAEDSHVERDDREIVKDAAKWCQFWGGNGHGMHAWY